MKYIKIIIILPFLILLQSCSLKDPKYMNFEKKETPNYYINEINSKILNGEDYSVEIFNTNLYKKFKIEDTEKLIIGNFLDSLSNDNYLDNQKPETKEVYEMRITFKNGKYVIKVFNETTITVFPWDGVYEEDLINMTNIPKRYNLLYFCKDIENRINLIQ